MKTKLTLCLILGLCLSFTSLFSQIKIDETGNAFFGTKGASIITHDADGIVTASLFGPNGGYSAGAKLAFGDFGSFQNNSMNVFIGEYGSTDSDKLWLHGKGGIYLTRNNGGSATGGSNSAVIGYYDNNYGNRFTFLCDIYSNSVKLASDERFKTNINPIENALSRLLRIEGISYNTRFTELAEENDSNTIETEVMMAPAKNKSDNEKKENKESEKDKKAKQELKEQKKKEKENEKNEKHLGVLAQDIKEVFPELVSMDSSGYFYVNYIGLIPVIIEALKEQQTLITAQSTKIKELEDLLEDEILNGSKENDKNDKKNNKYNNKTVSQDSDANHPETNAFLYQNAPNPFSNTSEIAYYIPNSSKNAILYILNLQGNMIKNERITQRGLGKSTINASDLSPGMYIYSLWIDEKEVDSKKMIVN